MKEYINTPFNYTGSKFKLLDQIYNHFPSKEDIDIFYDVFCGGGVVSLNCDYDNIVMNDIITPLMELYNDMYNLSIEEFEENILNHFIEKGNKNLFLQKRIEFNNTRDRYIFFNLVCSCTNNMMRFNKKFEFNQTYGERSYNSNTRLKLEKYMETIKTKKITFENKNFIDLVKSNKSESAFFYLDPPYLISEAGYNAYWYKELEDSLYDILDYIDLNKNKFILSNITIHKNKVNENMMKLYNKYNVIELDIDYEKVSRAESTTTKEVIVKNF